MYLAREMYIIYSLFPFIIDFRLFLEWEVDEVLLTFIVWGGVVSTILI